MDAASEVKAILDDPATAATARSDDFWVMAAGLKRFVQQEGNGSLPLEVCLTLAAAVLASLRACPGDRAALPALQGAIPDMTATTALYLQLQRLYREQADADVQAVGQHVQAVLQQVGRDRLAISSADIKTFCRHARYLR